MTDIQQFIQQYALDDEVKASRASPSSTAKSTSSKQKRHNRLLPFSSRKGRKGSGGAKESKDRVRSLAEVRCSFPLLAAPPVRFHWLLLPWEHERNQKYQQYPAPPQPLLPPSPIFCTPCCCLSPLRHHQTLLVMAS